MDKLLLENGKYEIEFNELESTWNIKRHGEQWHKIDLTDFPCAKMFISMFYQAQKSQPTQIWRPAEIKETKDLTYELGVTEWVVLRKGCAWTDFMRSKEKCIKEIEKSTEKGYGDILEYDCMLMSVSEMERLPAYYEIYNK